MLWRDNQATYFEIVVISYSSLGWRNTFHIKLRNARFTFTGDARLRKSELGKVWVALVGCERTLMLQEHRNQNHQ